MEDIFSDEPIKAIGVCRVATTQQEQECDAMIDQRQRIEKAAKDKNYVIVAWFEQVGRAKNPWEETALQEAHQYCMDNPDVTRLLVASPDRISRFLSSYRWWIDSFYAHDVDIEFTDFDTRYYKQTLVNMAIHEFYSRSQAAKKKGKGAVKISPTA